MNSTAFYAMIYKCTHFTYNDIVCIFTHAINYGYNNEKNHSRVCVKLLNITYVGIYHVIPI